MIYETGIYSARIVDAGIGESAEKKTPQVTLKVDILGKVEKDSAGVDTVYACPPGYRTIDLYLTDKTVDFVIPKLRTAGWEGEDFSGISSMVGLECYVSCKHEVATKGDKAGQTFDRFDLGIPTFKPIENDLGVAKKLNALFGKKLKDVKAKPANVPVAAANDTTPINDFDDVPF